MATKKSLSDMLRQEAGKSSETEVQSTIEVTADEIKTNDTPALEKLQLDTFNTNRAASSDSTNTELEVSITQLKESLEKAHQKERSLEEQIADMQSELSEQKALVKKLQKEVDKSKDFDAEQKTLVEKLQKELDKAKQVKTELEQAKAAAIQLAELNNKLTEEVNSLKKTPQSQGKSNTSIEKLPPKEVPAMKKTNEALAPTKIQETRRKYPHIPQLPPDNEPADFAAKTWLL